MSFRQYQWAWTKQHTITVIPSIANKGVGERSEWVWGEEVSNRVQSTKMEEPLLTQFTKSLFRVDKQTEVHPWVTRWLNWLKCCISHLASGWDMPSQMNWVLSELRTSLLHDILIWIIPMACRFRLTKPTVIDDLPETYSWTSFVYRRKPSASSATSRETSLVLRGRQCWWSARPWIIIFYSWLGGLCYSWGRISGVGGTARAWMTKSVSKRCELLMFSGPMAWHCY